jgi:hypothetical protein
MDNVVLARYINARRKEEDQMEEAQKKVEEEAPPSYHVNYI